MKPARVGRDGEDATEVRCPGRALQFKVIDGHTLEIKCSDRHCRDGDSVALHRYSLPDCKYIETLRFKDPFSRGRRARSSNIRKEVP